MAELNNSSARLALVQLSIVLVRFDGRGYKDEDGEGAEEKELGVDENDVIEFRMIGRYLVGMILFFGGKNFNIAGVRTENGSSFHRCL